MFGFFNTKSVYAELSPLALLLAAHIRISRRNRDSPKYALKQYSPAANRDQLWNDMAMCPFDRREESRDLVEPTRTRGIIVDRNSAHILRGRH